MRRRKISYAKCEVCVSVCVRPRGRLNVSSLLLVFFHSVLSRGHRNTTEVLNEWLLLLNKVEQECVRLCVCVCIGAFAQW